MWRWVDIFISKALLELRQQFSWRIELRKNKRKSREKEKPTSEETYIYIYL